MKGTEQTFGFVLYFIFVFCYNQVYQNKSADKFA